MKFSLTKRLYIGFSVAILLVLLIGILSYKTFQRQSEAGNWVKHTYQVLNKAGMIEKLVVDMETGRIGYRSTGVRQFLKPYDDALLNIKPVLNDLKSLTADNVVQTERISRIASNVETLLEFWNRQADGKLSQYDQKAFVDLITRQKEFIKLIRDELDQVVNTERILLNQREEQNKRSIEQATYGVVLGTFLTLLIVLTLIYFTIREFNNHRKAEAILQENYEELEHLNQISTEKNWLLTGMSVINDSLQDTSNVRSLTQSILKTVTKYLDVPASAFYCYSPKHSQLQINASVALPDHAKHTYQLGIGVVGQAATERSLTVVNDVPPDFWVVEAGSGQALPGQVVCLPLWYNKELKGVIELAAFRPLNEQALLLLKSVANNVAVAINAAEDHEKVMNLLQQVQEQKEELENQQEELQQSNDELTRQAEILHISEQELKVQEEELRQINDELLERNKTIEIARKELTEKAKELEINSRFKSEFLANMSHELRTPLNSVLILARLLSENKQFNLTDKQIEYAKIIHKSGADLLELINDILDLSKIEAGKIELVFEEAPVKGIVDDITQLFGVLADEKGIQLSTRVDPLVPKAIRTDKQRLEQVIKNLLSNAFKFTSKGGSVTLSLQLIDQRPASFKGNLTMAQQVIAISVTDTGIGIPPEKQQIIFEAFQQVDGSISRKFGGTGLGLSISKELIRKLGGELGLQSEIGKGSTFTIYLPITLTAEVDQPAPTDAPQITLAAIPESVAPARPSDDRHSLTPGQKVILIIEDDPAFASIIRDFAREKNFKTIIALRGDEGLQYARQYTPSAIILDMGLPVVNGWDLLKIMKNEDALKHIPVHVISAIDSPATVNDDILAYTTKPVDKKDLENVLAVISSHLDGEGKKGLVLAGTYLTKTSLMPLIDKRHINLECDYVNTLQEAQQKVSQQAYDCIIADIGQDVEQGIADLNALQQAVAPREVPFIIYLDKDLSRSAERELNKISSVIIRDSSLSKDRLMDELELFFHKIHQLETAPTPERPQNDSFDEGMQGRKVLLVDDDMRNVFALSTLLEANQMTVVTAGDGQEALNLLNKHTDTALVLMDIMMPEMDGYEATRRIRADRRFMNLPVIALTAKAMTGDREKCIEAGASDYITKPVDSTQLFSLMRVWLS
ncbi:response regulator [Spirosoma soli]|uniref:histidine kinase n=1 Tax=Spirosoma soli TaxID=1770529 RepID=A0ABW5M1E5_9BACT